MSDQQMSLRDLLRAYFTQTWERQKKKVLLHLLNVEEQQLFLQGFSEGYWEGAKDGIDFCTSNQVFPFDLGDMT